MNQTAPFPKLKRGLVAILRGLRPEEAVAVGRALFEAGIDPADDRRRFFVTDRGVTLITPEMLGQDMHHLR